MPATTAEPKPLPPDPLRLRLGSRLLLDACNERLLVELRKLPSLRTPETDPRFLLNQSLGYISTGIDACQVLLSEPWPVHALAVARPLFEHANRVLWATRGRWPRYWAWAAQEYVNRHKKAAPHFSPAEQLLRSPDFASAEKLAASPGMPDLATVLEHVAQDDAADPDTPESRLGVAVSARDGREQYHMILTLDLHVAAHGNPDVFSRRDQPIAERLSWLLSCTAVVIARACHIQCGWRQAPVFWAYGWITRGRRDTTEPEPTPEDSYGTLGLPALPGPDPCPPGS